MRSVRCPALPSAPPYRSHTTTLAFIRFWAMSARYSHVARRRSDAPRYLLRRQLYPRMRRHSKWWPLRPSTSAPLPKII